MDSKDEDYTPLTHQVAGCHSGTPSNILINRTGQILKPYKPLSNPTFDPDRDVKSVTNPKDLIPVTLNELQFYSKLDKAAASEPDFQGMQQLAPKYFGSKVIKGTDHLSLEDFTHGMKYPCVMDLKIGKDRYYPGRSADKAKQDNIKYPCLQEFGFCIAGIKLCNPATGEVDLHHMPKVTRKFSSDEVATHIRMFMHFEEECAETLRQKLREGGEAIHAWASNQRSVLLRGSSLLFVYDAAALRQDAETAVQVSDLKARVGMIDFAHVFHSFGEQDTNYVKGMTNLVYILKNGELPR